MRRPPVSTRAPAATERSTCSSRSGQDLGCGQRTHLGRFVHRVADLERLHARHEAPLELVGDRARSTMNRLAAMHDCPLLIVRALSRRAHGAPPDPRCGITMKGSLPPSSSTVFLMPCRPPRPPRARRVAAGERHRRDPRVLDDPAHRPRPDEQRLEAPLGKPGAAEDVLDGQRALRHVRRVLEQAHVARHQRRRREAEHLPERKVPRHHRQHRADRLIADEVPPGLASTGSSASRRSPFSA